MRQLLGCGSPSGISGWGPDAPVILLQAATVQQFVDELLKMYVPPHKSLIDDVHEDRLFEVWSVSRHQKWK
jgi:hypothetical protein